MSHQFSQQSIPYQCDEVLCHGWLCHPTANEGYAPGIVVFHAWRGQDDFAREKAAALAQLGYVALAADLYGAGITAQSDQEAHDLMTPLFFDRGLLQKRAIAALETLRKSQKCHPHELGAIGFCFGGLTAIELLRSGAALRGAVSFHGVLGSSMDGKQAIRPPPPEEMKGSLLILHGNDDPLVSEKDIHDIQKEMTTAAVDWQMHIYGHTSHAFTNPMAHDPAHGLSYQATSAHRAWQAMENFFSALFGAHKE